MSFMKRAFLYVSRKKGKTFLLFAILLIMATFVLTGLSIWKAAETAQFNLRKSLGANFDIEVDWSEDNPYMVKEQVEGTDRGESEKKSINYIMYSKKQLTPKNVADIKQMEGVKYCNASTEVLSKFSDVSLFPGTIPVDTAYHK